MPGLRVFWLPTPGNPAYQEGVQVCFRGSWDSCLLWILFAPPDPKGSTQIPVILVFLS